MFSTGRQAVLPTSKVRRRPRLGEGPLARLSSAPVLVAINMAVLFGVLYLLYSSMSETEGVGKRVGLEARVNGGVVHSESALGELKPSPLRRAAEQAEADRQQAAGEQLMEEPEGEDEESEEGEAGEDPPAAKTTRRADPPPKSYDPPVKVDIPQSREVTPLESKYQKLWEDLKTKQEPILTLPRLGKMARISCGGTTTMGFKTWGEIKASSPNINHTLPVRRISLPLLAKAVEDSPCWKTSKYKKAGCEFMVPTGKGPEEEPLCAVVGNSGKLREQYWQNEIDSCDIVIRFNNGPTKRFEKHVGTKSTIRLFNGPYTGPKQPGEMVISELRDLAIRHWVKSWMKRPPGEMLAFVMDPELICHAWEWVSRAGEKPSSGITGILLALRLCRHVHVFGFAATDYFDKKAWPHYYDHERPKPGREDVHPFAQEAQIYQMLQAAGKLTMHG
eukprot:jgi/Tetstr1/443709/TSEL_031699.t1